MAIDQRETNKFVSIFAFIVAVGALIFALIGSSGSLGFVSGCFFIIGIITLIIAQIGFKAYNKRLTTYRSNREPISYGFFPNISERTITPPEANSQEKKTISRQPKAELLIDPFKSTIEEKEAICMVCKLKIRKDEEIYQCPECNNYFHAQHLERWLEQRTRCPVCECMLKTKNRFSTK